MLYLDTYTLLVRDACGIYLVEVANATSQTYSGSLQLLLSLGIPPSILESLRGSGHGILRERRSPSLLRGREPVASSPQTLAAIALGHDTGDGAREVTPLSLRLKMCDADYTGFAGEEARPGAPNAYAQRRDSAQTCDNDPAHYTSMAQIELGRLIIGMRKAWITDYLVLGIVETSSDASANQGGMDLPVRVGR